MVDSTNPRVMADNIKMLAVRDVGSIVEANPTGAATADLEKLGVDGTIYGIPEGTTVEANPEGAATDELEKLGVGTGIYSIPGLHIITDTVTTTTDSSGTMAVTFQSPMPDTNYAISIMMESGGVGWADYNFMVSSKTVNGFSISFYNPNTHDAAGIRYYVLY